VVDPTLAIETDALTKQYGRHLAVQDLHLRVPRGAVCGFWGRNGASKTTTIGLLTGLLRPTRGGAWPARRARQFSCPGTSSTRWR
jgi:ABC-type multidrug transport system ATPase subunit